MRPLRCSINVTLDGCCDHQVEIPDEESHRYTVDWNAALVQGDLRNAVEQLKQEAGYCLFERLELKLVGRQEFGSGAVALRYQPSRAAT